jgi:hypothetical protein
MNFTTTVIVVGGSSGPVSVTANPPVDTTNTGTLAVDQAEVDIPTQGLSTVQITLKWAAAASMIVNFEQLPNASSNPSTDWIADTVTSEQSIPHATSGELVDDFTVSGASGAQTFIASVGAYYKYRVRCHPYTSGSVSVGWEASVQPNAATNLAQITDMTQTNVATVKAVGSGVTPSTDCALTIGIRTASGDGGTQAAPLFSTPTLSTSMASLSRQAVGTSATALGPLVARANGILVTADPSNTALVWVSGNDVSTTQGQPMTPGASYTFPQSNASNLYAVSTVTGQGLFVSAI